MYYKLSDYALKFNVTYRTAWNSYKQGKIQGAFMDETGHVCIPLPTVDNGTHKKAALYARVSSHAMKNNLKRQTERLKDYAAANGYKVIAQKEEIASGLNDKRNHLIKLLRRDDWDTLIVENKDRLTRFGFNYLQLMLDAQNRKLVVINSVGDDAKADLVSDLVSIIYSFSARIYGLRKAKEKRKEITDKLELPA